MARGVKTTKDLPRIGEKNVLLLAIDKQNPAVAAMVFFTATSMGYFLGCFFTQQTVGTRMTLHFYRPKRGSLLLKGIPAS